MQTAREPDMWGALTPQNSLTSTLSLLLIRRNELKIKQQKTRNVSCRDDIAASIASAHCIMALQNDLHLLVAIWSH